MRKFISYQSTMPKDLALDLIISAISVILDMACIVWLVCFIIWIVKIIKNKDQSSKKSWWKLVLILPIAILLAYWFRVFTRRLSVNQAKHRLEEYRNSVIETKYSDEQLHEDLLKIELIDQKQEAWDKYNKAYNYGLSWNYDEAIRLLENILEDEWTVNLWSELYDSTRILLGEFKDLKVNQNLEIE